MAARKSSSSKSPSSTVKTRRAGAGSKPRVARLMGSANDWDVMQAAAEALEKLGVASDVRVISAHRTPERHHSYVTSARKRGIEVFICGAGFAAHLAGVTAALTPLPVLGVPIDSSALDGLDALLATVQMPGDVPVASMAVGMGGPRNAGLFAVQILGTADPELRQKFAEFKRSLVDKIKAKNEKLQSQL